MLSKTAQNITPSATIELTRVVAEMRSQGIDIIGFNVGEPDFDTPANIREACKKAIDEGKTRYVTASGIAPLKSSIARKLKRDNHIEYSPAQICVSTGAKQAVNNAVMAVAGAGDEVIIPTPCWVSYVEIVKLMGAKPVCVETGADYGLDPERIRKAITPATAAIIINTPNNPTGAVYTREALRELTELAAEHDFYIISDEVYEKLIYNGRVHVSPAEISGEGYDHTVVINGLSKAYAMTGFRIGYSAAPPDVARAISSIQGHTTSNSTTFVQYAAIEALDHSEGSVREMAAEFEKRRDYAYGRLSAMRGLKCGSPDGAFYFLPDVSAYFGLSDGETEIRDSMDLCDYILRKAHVAIVPGAAFEAPECVRISYANSMDNIVEGLDRIEKALGRLR